MRFSVSRSQFRTPNKKPLETLGQWDDSFHPTIRMLKSDQHTLGGKS